MTIDVVRLDCKGMQCPAPILAVARAARTNHGPFHLEIAATDGDFPVDIEAWCRSTGARLSSVEHLDGVFVARVALNGAPDAQLDGSEDSTPTPRPAPERAQTPTVDVDCLGMCCPAPILQVARVVRGLREPTMLRVLADDGDFPVDIEAWCRSASAELVGIETEGGRHVATIALHGASVAAAPAPTPEVVAPAMDAPAPVSATPPASAVLDLRSEQGGMALLRLGQAVMGGEGVRFLAGPALRGQLETWASAIGARLDLAVDGDVLRGSVTMRAAPPSLPPTPAPVARDAAPAMRAVPVPVAAPPAAAPAVAVPKNMVLKENRAAFLVLRNDFESLMAALMCANASAAQGMAVEIYFSFWGVNVLRGESPRAPAPGTAIEKVNPLKKMMKWMMPAGPEAQKMSKMHMGGMGLGMMKYFMKEQNVLGLRELMREAAELDVKFVVCTMSMGIMGIQKEDLMDLPNIAFGGVTSFTSSARVAATSMVF